MYETEVVYFIIQSKYIINESIPTNEFFSQTLIVISYM